VARSRLTQQGLALLRGGEHCIYFPSLLALALNQSTCSAYKSHTLTDYPFVHHSGVTMSCLIWE